MDAEQAAGVAHDLADPLLVEQYERFRSDRLAKDREAEALKEIENVYKAELIRRMLDAKTGALASTVFIARLQKKDVPTPKDWGKVRKYIIDHDAWELMQNRLATAAVTERWQAGETIPGIEAFPTYNITISRI